MSWEINLYNQKREEPSILIVPTKVAESMAEVIAQLVKPTKVPLRYPYIIYSSFEHHAPYCPRKTEVQNMFQTCFELNQLLLPL
jgi:hypothetical protein